jgi:hypothetical protein
MASTTERTAEFKTIPNQQQKKLSATKTRTPRRWVSQKIFNTNPIIYDFYPSTMVIKKKTISLQWNPHAPGCERFTQDCSRFINLIAHEQFHFLLANTMFNLL